MRIVSGKYRGKKLKEFDLTTTKPTLDKVKESIFNLIQFDVCDAIVLDLFAGTGALGIEAISRGAKRVHMVEKNPQAIKLIKANLQGIEGEYFVHNMDYADYINQTKERFDIVLLDPPYATEFGLVAIRELLSHNLLSNNATIIFETSVQKDISFDDLPFDVKRKKYGSVLVYKLEKL